MKIRSRVTSDCEASCSACAGQDVRPRERRAAAGRPGLRDQARSSDRDARSRTIRPMRMANPRAASSSCRSMIVDHPPQGGQTARCRCGSQAAAAQNAGLVEGAAAFVDDDRRPHRERLEHDVAERLGEERRHHDRAGAAEEPGQRRAAQQPLEVHVRQVRGQRPQARPRTGRFPAIRRSTSGRYRISGISR